jgi:hypothetical protein
MNIVLKQVRLARLIRYDIPLSAQKHFQVPVIDRCQLTFEKRISRLVLEIRIIDIAQLLLHVGRLDKRMPFELTDSRVMFEQT